MAQDESPLMRWLTVLLHRAAALDPEWGRAVAAERDSVPAGNVRLLWTLGGLWFLARRRILRQRATLAQRLFAALGVIWAGLFGYAFAQSLWDDAPDMPWPYSLRLVLAQAAVLAAFAVAMWRPALALLCAGPVLVVQAIADGTTPGADRVVAVAIFAGFPALIFGLLALLTAAGLASGRDSSTRATAG